jgi:hypothetical protein
MWEIRSIRYWLVRMVIVSHRRVHGHLEHGLQHLWQKSLWYKCCSDVVQRQLQVEETAFLDERMIAWSRVLLLIAHK